MNRGEDKGIYPQWKTPHYSEKDEILPFAKWMELEGIMLNERSHKRERQIPDGFLYMQEKL